MGDAMPQLDIPANLLRGVNELQARLLAAQLSLQTSNPEDRCQRHEFEAEIAECVHHMRDMELAVSEYDGRSIEDKDRAGEESSPERIHAEEEALELSSVQLANLASRLEPVEDVFRTLCEQLGHLQQGLDDGTLQNAEAHSPGMHDTTMEACICLQGQLDDLNKRMTDLETGLVEAGVLDRSARPAAGSLHDGGFCADRHVGQSNEQVELEGLR